ncbi:NAD(P)/FAD-dependent oxidoreductase [Nocardioides sp. R1-1]|uniref:NAD(P)/FAD-dependent oxidoreductase n=1 Tax=Nocardioides sp. R1-1 TaxID=3383502 RepID=UPI0038CFF7E7
MEPARVVIVGAGLAGLRTAERLRREGYDGAVTLVGAEEHLPYDRPPLSKALLVDPGPVAPPLLRAADRYAELDLDLRVGVRATALDADRRTVALSDGAVVQGEHVVIATGLVARDVPGWAGVPGVHTLRTYDDCLALRDAAEDAAHATVVGAGVLGSEIAGALRTRGLEVDLVDPLPQPLHRVVGEEVGAFVAALHREHGVRTHLGATVAGLEQDAAGRVRAATLDDGTRWETDLVVAAVGGTPDVAWLRDSGLAVADGVVVDADGAASAAGVWAVGDVASLPGPRGGRLRLEHWTSAGDLAATVARNLMADLRGAPRRAHAEVPYLWTDQYDTKVQVLGLPRADDDAVLLAGSFAEATFLVAYVDDGRVRAVAGAGMPGPLMRCRAAVAGAVPLDELRTLAPWERRKVSA